MTSRDAARVEEEEGRAASVHEDLRRHRRKAGRCLYFFPTVEISDFFLNVLRYAVAAQIMHTFEFIPCAHFCWQTSPSRIYALCIYAQCALAEAKKRSMGAENR